MGKNTTHTTTAITRLTVVGFAAVLTQSACGSNDDSNDATADSANVDAPAEEIAANAAAAYKEGNALFSSADTTRAGPHQAPSTEPIALAPPPTRAELTHSATAGAPFASKDRLAFDPVLRRKQRFAVR